LNFDLQSFVDSICIVMRSTEHALVTGKACCLFLCLLHVVVTNWFRSMLSNVL